MDDILLSIIIPYYTETPQAVFPMLASINGQVGVDFSKIQCILVNDGNHNIFSDKFLALFEKLSIHCIYLEQNHGPGMARQQGIDAAAGAYVMFCDADDTLSNVAVLKTFLQEIAHEHPDILRAPWSEECLLGKTGELVYKCYHNDYNWMHGKAFNRSFLLKKNIRFHEKLRECEDRYFLAVAAMEAGHIHNTKILSYVWKWNPQSITRSDSNAFTFGKTAAHIKTISYTFDEIAKRHPKKMPYIVTDFIILCFFQLTKPIWQHPENSEHLTQAKSAFRETMKMYGRHYEEASDLLVAELYNKHRAVHLASLEEREAIPLKQWLKDLMPS